MTARRLVWATLFGVAMGFLEAVVVVYLRHIYYPGGFDFPLVMLPLRMAGVELARELATLVMLWAVAALAGRTGWERFAFFSYLFGVWDLAYYAGLSGMLGWPRSVMTWDILFLIPVLWTGPVLAPCLVSIGLIGGALVVLRFEALRIRIGLTRVDVGALAAVLVLLLYCFLENHRLAMSGGVPHRFSWALFALAMAIGLATLIKGVLFNPRSRLPRRYGLH